MQLAKRRIEKTPTASLVVTSYLRRNRPITKSDNIHVPLTMVYFSQEMDHVNYL